MSTKFALSSGKDALVNYRVQMVLPETLVKKIRQEAADENRTEAKYVAQLIKEVYAQKK